MSHSKSVTDTCYLFTCSYAWVQISTIERNVMSAMYSKYPWMQAWGFNHTYCIYQLLETEGVETLKAMSISFVSWPPVAQELRGSPRRTRSSTPSALEQSIRRIWPLWVLVPASLPAQRWLPSALSWLASQLWPHRPSSQSECPLVGKVSWGNGEWSREPTEEEWVANRGYMTATYIHTTCHHGNIPQSDIDTNMWQQNGLHVSL